MKEYLSRIADNEKIFEGFHRISVEIEGKVEKNITPGQFAMIGAVPSKEGVLLRRPYSIFDAKGKGKKSHLSFFFKVIGKGTKLLSEARAGENLSLLAPLGNGFDLFPAKKKHVMIVTGGMGIVPFNLFMKQIGNFEPSGIYSFYGARKKSQFFFKEIFKKADKAYFATDDGSLGYKGFVSNLFRQKLEGDKELKDLDPKEILVYTCGPREMIREVSAISEAKGIKCFVSMEESMGCGFGVCLSCVVKSKNGTEEYTTVCKEGPIFDSKTILV